MATKRQLATPKARSKSRAKVVTNKNTGSWIQNKWLAVVVVAVFAVIGTTTLLLTRAASISGAITGVAGKCLDNNGAKAANSNKIQLWDCNKTAAQIWSMPGDGTLRVQGYCLDVRVLAKNLRH